jgi:hypothetical protein
MTTGTFVLADIGGYTTFLSEVGIEHAKEITSHLFNGMVKVSKRWKVGNVEGDCLFLYTSSRESPENTFGQVRKLYEDFRASVAEVASGSTCRCGACDRSGDLVLKFVVHQGEFDTHEVAGRRELIGPDVVVAHRLLKNSVPVREYAILTSPLADVAHASGLPTTPASDEYSDIGAVEYLYVDLQPVREAFEKSRELYLTEETADVCLEIEIEAPPELVWRAITDPDRAKLWAPTLVEAEPLSGEYGKVGGVHTCLHGGGIKMIHLVVAHDEEGRRHTDRLWNVPFVNEAYIGCEIRPSPQGTKALYYFSLRPGLPIAGNISKSRFLRASKKHAEDDLRGLKAICEAEVRGLPLEKQMAS